MAATSAVKRLPDDVRSLLEGWLKEFLAGRLSLDEVMVRLEGHMALSGLDPQAAPSRSSVHRYAQKFEAVVQRIERSKELTNLLAEQLGPEVADGRGVQVMVQAVQSLTYDLLASLEEGTAVDPKAIHDLAKAAHHLAAAQKTDADRALKIEEAVRRKAAADVAKLGRKLGWSAETAKSVREEILGVKLGAATPEPADEG
ncbi:phage protein Gp27 family protein [Brevundimonas aurantiaca]|jgi:hypothetical protein|uniref:phage protein Gp27 family protein n=1 Tax=Brevundimonas aurantiaca TaxID=74316 RepID=UPI002FDE1B13